MKSESGLGVANATPPKLAKLTSVNYTYNSINEDNPAFNTFSHSFWVPLDISSAS
jgi:hypothetical protein